MCFAEPIINHNYSAVEQSAAREDAREFAVKDVFGAFKQEGSQSIVYGVHYTDCIGHETEYMWQPLELPEERGFDADFKNMKVFMLWRDSRRTRKKLEKHKAIIGKQDTDESHSVLYKNLARSNIFLNLSTLENLNQDTRPQPIVGWVKVEYAAHLPPWLR